MTRVALVFDEGPGAGLGHRRRMEALAHAFTALGHECDLRSGAHEAVAPIVVVDSYRFHADDPTHFSGEVVAAIDDLARDLAVDLVVDPSPGADRTLHRRADLVLAGERYALVEPAGVRELSATVRRVLVTTGAADEAGTGAAMAATIAAALPDVTVRLVVGAWGSRRVPAGVEAVEAPHGLAAEFAAADVVVTAGGVTLLESLLCGLPTVAVTIAENQRLAVRALGRRGAAAVATPDTAAAEVVALVEDDERRAALARTAASVIDGRGPARVAAEITRVAGVRQRMPA